MIDELIALLHSAVVADINDHTKIGDFIKMIELRHKLAPASADQEKIWSMVDKARRKVLSQDDTVKPVPAKTNRRKKTVKASKS